LCVELLFYKVLVTRAVKRLSNFFNRAFIAVLMHILFVTFFSTGLYYICIWTSLAHCCWTLVYC